MDEKNRVPGVLADYAVYLGNSRLVGTGEVTLPSITGITAEVSGAGIGGKIELPVIGQFESMTLGIAFKTQELSFGDLMRPEAKDVTIRGAQQSFDGVGGGMQIEGFVIRCRVFPKAGELGKLKSGDPMDGSCELEVLRIRVTQGQQEILEIDKLNGIYRVRGVDYGSGIRAELGIG